MNAPSLLAAAPAVCCEDEKWELIPGWPYEASSCGRGRSIDRLGDDGIWRLGAILPPQPDKRPGKGYLYWDLRDGKRRRRVPVAVAVLEAHRKPRPGPGYEACHNDGVRTDNHLAKLRWDTKKANRADTEWHRMMAHPAGGWNPPEGRPGVLISVKEAAVQGWLPPVWSNPTRGFSVAKTRAAKAGRVTPRAKARAEDGNTLLYDEAELAGFIREATSYLLTAGRRLAYSRAEGLNGDENEEEETKGRETFPCLRARDRNGKPVTGDLDGRTPSDLRSVTSQGFFRLGRYMRRYTSRRAA